MKKLIYIIGIIVSGSTWTYSQDSLIINDSEIVGEVASKVASDNSSIVNETFASIRVINNHSIEMIPVRSLEFIVSHKFGDLAGSNGGVATWFGLDNLEDVRIAFEYGLYKNMNIGLGRSKGIGHTTQVVDGYYKYSILQQRTSKMPISLVFVSALSIPYGPASTDSTAPNSYPTFLNRFIFTNQILIARKFSDRISLQMNVGYNHRNYVDYKDQNGLFFAGISGRFRMTKSIGFLFEYIHILDRPSAITYTNHLAVGIELLTGGHAFALTFSNSTGMTENLFIPYTNRNWFEGQFRFGFSINRRFKL